MRALTQALLLLPVVACSRPFNAPSGQLPSPQRLVLSDGRSVDPSEAAPVAAGDTLRIQGTDLQQASVLVGSAPGQVLARSAAELRVALPTDLAQASIGQPVTVAVLQDGRSFPAGQVRLYAPPHLQLSGDTPGFNAPGDALLQGQGFSPDATDLRVTVGGASAQVLLASTGVLQARLDAATPEGPQTLAVDLVPAGLPATIKLHAEAIVYVWKQVEGFWIFPQHALPGQRVRLIRGDNSAVAGLVSNYTANHQPGALGNLEQVADATRQEAGLKLNYTSLVDAGAVVDPAEQIPDGLDGGVPTLRQNAHPGLKLAIDGVPSASAPQLGDDRGVSFTAPAGLLRGQHQVQLVDPAGASPPGTFSALAGHLESPSLSCFPSDFTGQGLLRTVLRDDETEGSVVALQQDDSGALNLARVHPGGFSEVQDFSFLSAELAGTGGIPVVVGSGRDLIYVFMNKVEADPSALHELRSYAYDPVDGTHYQADTVYLAEAPWAVKEASFGDPFLWTVSGKTPPLPLTHFPLLPFEDSNVSATVAPGCDSQVEVADVQFSDALVLAAVNCARDLLLGYQEVPSLLPALDDGGFAGFSAPPQPWYRFPMSDDTGAPLPGYEAFDHWRAHVSERGAVVVAPGNSLAGMPGGLAYADPLFADQAPSIVDLGYQQLDGVAISPDGQQLLAVGVRGSDPGVGVHLYSRSGPGPADWRYDGALPLPDGLGGEDVTYDASGSQAVVLLQPKAPQGGPLGGASTLVDGGMPNGGWCLLR